MPTPDNTTRITNFGDNLSVSSPGGSDTWRKDDEGSLPPVKDSDPWSELFGQKNSSPVSLDETPPAEQIRSTVADHRQILNIIFLIDVSGSMRGQRIAMVNNAMENIIKELRKRDELQSTIKISILEFSETARWVTTQPIPVQHFVFRQIEAQPWLTNYGPAFDALNAKLSRKAFMNPDMGEYFAPLILFVTDGEPTDVDSFPNALARLNRNGWFLSSSKYAIAVGEDARSQEVIKTLSLFAGIVTNVRYADEGEALCNLIEFITINASSILTSMVTSPTDQKGYLSSVFTDNDPDLFSSMFD